MPSRWVYSCHLYLFYSEPFYSSLWLMSYSITPFYSAPWCVTIPAPKKGNFKLNHIQAEHLPIWKEEDWRGDRNTRKPLSQKKMERARYNPDGAKHTVWISTVKSFLGVWHLAQWYFSSSLHLPLPPEHLPSLFFIETWAENPPFLGTFWKVFLVYGIFFHTCLKPCYGTVC